MPVSAAGQRPSHSHTGGRGCEAEPGPVPRGSRARGTAFPTRRPWGGRRSSVSESGLRRRCGRLGFHVGTSWRVHGRAESAGRVSHVRLGWVPLLAPPCPRRVSPLAGGGGRGASRDSCWRMLSVRFQRRAWRGRVPSWWEGGRADEGDGLEYGAPLRLCAVCAASEDPETVGITPL